MSSSTDYAKGFGGRYGVQADRVDKVNLINVQINTWTWSVIVEWHRIVSSQSAASFSEMESPTSSYEKTQPLEACKWLLR